MCGIVGILSRPSSRPTPTGTELLGGLDAALAARGDVLAVTAAAGAVDAALRGVPGLLALVEHHELVAAITARLDQLDAYAAEVDAEVGRSVADADELERASAASIALRDVLWALRRDRLRTVREVADLAGRGAGAAALAGYLAIQQAFSTIDRMEVRGRDSAGIHVMVWDHDLDVDDRALAATLAERGRDPLFQSGAARFAGRALSIVYKAAAEIGELGDNTRVMREAVRADRLLRLALSGERAQLAVLGHTRWASVGIISEPNAHPVNSDELEQPGGATPPFVVGVLNGDVDNHADLRVEHALRFARPITTDAKVIPALVARHRQSGTVDLFDAFRRTVSSFEGSVAIGVAAADEPGRLYLALHGSGQAHLHRPRRGPLRGRQRALRRRRGDRSVRAPRRRARRPGRRARRRGRRHDRRHPPARLRRLRAAGQRVRRRHGRGDDAGHRPRRQSALPAQGDQRVARQPGQDAAREARRARRAGARRGRQHVPFPTMSRRAWPPARSPGSG